MWRFLKTIFKSIAAIIVLFIIGAAIWLAYYEFFIKEELHTEVETVVENFVSDYSESWKTEDVKSYFSDEMKTWLEQTKLNKPCDLYLIEANLPQLGKFVKNKGIHEEQFGYEASLGEGEYAQVVYNLEFENKTSPTFFWLERIDDEWKINNYNFSNIELEEKCQPPSQ